MPSFKLAHRGGETKCAKCRASRRISPIRRNIIVPPPATIRNMYIEDDWTMSSTAGSDVVPPATTTVHRVKCYTPADSVGKSSVSCITDPEGYSASLTTDRRLVVIPADSIIDRVEFFGHDDFSVKERFYIGLGQLNDSITFPIIVGATSDIANEKIGGCFDFVGTDPSGANHKNVVLYDSFVNVNFDNPLSRGSLTIFVTYHLRS